MVNKLPHHLKTYIVEQHYKDYTPREHSTWRYIMRQSRHFLSKHAHPSYLPGLKATGLSIHCIPKIEEINHHLNKFGWNAVCVRGFIPPLTFLEFQSQKILPIAADMRTLENISYTPAPDIVHEAAGHAPFLADEGYRHYLTQYARLAKKAIFSLEDNELYEAIRQLSDMKENPDYTKHDIQKAQENLTACTKKLTKLSESHHLSRLYWWSAEYGLVGSMNNPLIYGAGLLSSLEESQDALTDKVALKEFDINCMHQAYDITHAQPQLFITPNFKKLTETLNEFEKNMCFQVGGISSLETARQAKAVTTTQLNSGIAASGILSQYKTNTDGEVTFLAWQGPVQLSYKEKELANQGCKQHPHGFSSPIGRWKKTQTLPQELSDNDLSNLGLIKSRFCQLQLSSGFLVEGTIQSWQRSAKGTLILISWTNCTVKQHNDVYFQADWGDFDMLVGTEVNSVYGGPADLQHYKQPSTTNITTSPKRKSAYTQKEQQLFELYQHTSRLRQSTNSAEQIENSLIALTQKIAENHAEEWLLGLEVFELAIQKLSQNCNTSAWYKTLAEDILRSKKQSKHNKKLIEKGLRIAQIKD